MKYLLDTNILSDVIRNPRGAILRKITQVGESQVCTSIVVASELRFGAQKRGSVRLSREEEVVLNAVEVLALEAPADHYYARLRHDLEVKGTPIGPNDLFIASQALALDLVLVTANTSEFSRVANLSLENWLPTTP